MAQQPGRACRWPGCTAIVHSGIYCDAHRATGRRQGDRALDARRGSARQRGYNAEWERFRVWFMNQPSEQLCGRCKEHGKVTLATLVHHIIPVRTRPDLRLVASNCMALCRRCHEDIHRELSND